MRYDQMVKETEFSGLPAVVQPAEGQEHGIASVYRSDAERRKAPIAEMVSPKMWSDYYLRQTKDMLARRAEKACWWIGVAMMVAGLIPFTGIVAPVNHETLPEIVLFYLAAFMIAYIGYRFYRYGGGLPIFDLRMKFFG